VPDWYRRFGGRDKEQAAPLEFAPAAGVTIVAKLDKIDRTVVFARPHTLGDLALTRIDLDECARTDQGIERVVLGPDIPIKHISETCLLQQEERHLTQTLKHSMDQTRPLQGKLLRQFQRRRYNRLSSHERQPAEVGVWQV
jgi:hypothetical protein